MSSIRRHQDSFTETQYTTLMRIVKVKPGDSMARTHKSKLYYIRGELTFTIKWNEEFGGKEDTLSVVVYSLPFCIFCSVENEQRNKRIAERFFGNFNRYEVTVILSSQRL